MNQHPTVDSANALFRETPEVQQCFYVTGGVSFVLIIVAPDMRSYEGLTRRLFAENELIERFRTLVALERFERSTDVVDHARSHSLVQPVLPTVTESDHGVRILLPGDPEGTGGVYDAWTARPLSF